MSAFTDDQLSYLLGERRLARVATVGKDGTPHVVPVGWSYNAEHDTIDIGGRDFERTKKYRDVRRSGRAAVVIDDLESVDPWRPRGVEVRGRAEALEQPVPLIRIHPDRIVSWGIEGEAHKARSASRRITEVVTSWPGVEAGPGRRGEFAFKLGRREIGHLHGDHAAHFSFPKEVWAELKEEGRIVDHPVFPGKPGPGARRIEDESDIEDVIELLRLNYDRMITRDRAETPTAQST